MLGSRLKKLRLDKKLTQLQVAQKVNISEARYNLYENNRRQPDYELLKSLAEVLDTTTDYLLGNDSTTKTINSVISDTELADTISELETRTFLTNSDAHSLPKIAREYNKMLVEDISFKEVVKALKNEDGRKIIANYGLDPKLGKYHRSFCEDCDKAIEIDEAAVTCPECGGSNITFGVFDRIELVKDKENTQSPEIRPQYVYQVPLTFIPGVGGKTIDKLLNAFETEMNILHKLSKDDIEAVVGEKIANTIERARTGGMTVHSGGGGNYGKIE